MRPAWYGRALRAPLGQLRGVPLGVLAGGGVDEAGAGQPGDRVEERRLLAVVLGEALDGQVQVRPVEAGDDLPRRAHPQPLDDLGAHRRRGGGRQRDDRRRAEALEDVADPQVVGPEVVTPGRHAVRLVDHEERDARRGEPVDDVVVRELLGGEEDELGVAGAQRLPGLRWSWPRAARS